LVIVLNYLVIFMVVICALLTVGYKIYFKYYNKGVDVVKGPQCGD